MTENGLRAEVKRLQGILRRYRWQALATDLVVCTLVRRRQDSTSSVGRMVIHRRDCRHVPGRDHQGTWAGNWVVNSATGHDLASAIERGAKACGTCKPEVDPEAVIDP